MTRLIALALLLLILWLAVGNFMQRLRAVISEGDSPRRPLDRDQRPAAVETLVPCAACGTYVPASRSLAAPGGGGGAFCSEECRERGPA
jgi:hypothetical protein